MPLDESKWSQILKELESVLPNGDLSIAELAERTKLHPSTIYRYIPVLEAKEFVNITRTIDRAALYQITPKGIEYLKKEGLIGSEKVETIEDS